MNVDNRRRGRRELAHRVSGGMEVTLYWSVSDDRTSIEIEQPATGEAFAFEVARDRALDVFYHPFAHLPLLGHGLLKVAVQS